MWNYTPMANTGRYEMYYDRTLTSDFSNLIEETGSLRWLFDFVKSRADLDFLIGKNNSNEWISIYRGLTRILRIVKVKDEKLIKLDATLKYKKMVPSLYGVKNIKDIFKKDIELLITMIEKDSVSDRYYKNQKEGFYQNKLSREFGICGKIDNDFVIIDKESVIGYSNEEEKKELLDPIRSNYKKIQKSLSVINPSMFGSKVEEKSIGNELDFIALNKEGDILLIEYKHGTNTNGIYLSPLQIGMYYDIFTDFPREKLEKAIMDMLVQKQKIGLIQPGWKIPKQFKDIIPVLIISEYNYEGSGKDTFEKVMDITKKELNRDDFLKNLRKYNFTSDNGLTTW